MTKEKKMRPLICALDESVRGILDGTKTQTRRLAEFVPLQPRLNLGFSGLRARRSDVDDGAFVLVSDTRTSEAARTRPLRWHGGDIGDVLWVKEAWAPSWDPPDPELTVYRATDAPIMSQSELDAATWRNPMFMPKKRARLWIRVKGVRVERLQRITEADAKAEGAPLDASPCDHARRSCEEVGCLGKTHRAGFCNAWTKLHGAKGPASWGANPWVFVITFVRVMPMLPWRAAA